MSTLRSFLVVIGALTMTWIAAKEMDAAIFAQWGYGRDSTDSVGRSGLGLRTDALTGCEYLISPYGGLTPRLDMDGQHICRRAALKGESDG